MDKETLSNYGWIVICVLVLAVMIALATPFGSFISDAVKSTTQGLFDVNQGALDAAGITIDDNAFVEGNGGAGSGTNNTNTIIPTGGTYYIGVTSDQVGNYAGATTILTSGQPFPETVSYGDVYVYGDYEYKYGYYFAQEEVWAEQGNLEDGPYGYGEDYFDNGWGVRVLDTTKSSYEPMLGSINNEPVVTISYTYAYCENLITAPALPHGITNMQQTFMGCSNMTTAPTIPDSVTHMFATFGYCHALPTAPKIPNGVVTLEATFTMCLKLTVAPEIPDSVTTMQSTFSYCRGLTTAPVIPSSVKNMYTTFENCTQLTGTVVINTNPTSRNERCFNNVDFESQGITLAGSSTMLDTLGATGKNYCAECNGKCNGGH